MGSSNIDSRMSVIFNPVHPGVTGLTIVLAVSDLPTHRVRSMR